MATQLFLSDPGMRPRVESFQSAEAAFLALRKGVYPHYTAARIEVDGQPLHAAVRELGGRHWFIRTFTAENLLKGFNAACHRWAAAIMLGCSDGGASDVRRQLYGAMTEYQADYDSAYSETLRP
jgi:hypothetical protein